MKYLLEAVWKFVLQISTRVSRIINPSSNLETALSSPSSHQNRSRRVRKLKRKRKSFQSFLREESLARKNNKLNRCKKRKIKRERTGAEEEQSGNLWCEQMEEEISE